VPRPLAVLLLVVCTIIWGFAFVAQKLAMSSMGPLTFTACRMLLGGLVILPLSIREYRRAVARGRRPTRRQWLLIGLLATAFFLGSWLQQTGLVNTTVTNGGFLTSLYVLFTPLIAFVVMRARPHPIIYLGAPLALVGIFYLNGGRLDRLGAGDLTVILSAAFWGVHVFLVGRLARETGLPVFLSGVSFLAAGLAAAVLAQLFETPSLSGILPGWVEIAYAGILSTALAFTLQALGQQYVPEANAAVILSSESLFAALGGALFLGERLDLVGYAGAGLIFLAILLVEVVPAIGRRRTSAAAG
jgi:drug/metabolite transporter (DMT)-like permease